MSDFRKPQSVLDLDIGEVDELENADHVNRRLKDGWILLEVGEVRDGDTWTVIYIVGNPRGKEAAKK